MSDYINLSNIDYLLQNFLDDKYVSTSIILFLILYTVLIAPKLPRELHHLFDSQLFKLFLLFFIMYVSTKNHSIGLVLVIAYLTTMNTVNKIKIDEKIFNVLILNATNEKEEHEIKPQKAQEKHEVHIVNLPNTKESHELKVSKILDDGPGSLEQKHEHEHEHEHEHSVENTFNVQFLNRPTNLETIPEHLDILGNGTENKYAMF